ncbi:MAG: metal-dependent transcriptional regulator [Calditrichaeota bacterium]|nr:metal-dependent transcriptional regulator [Calditrichota bacterium]MCB0267565.1 metal-dependent transcriptional regulator [Calditrichota bacterium]
MVHPINALIIASIVIFIGLIVVWPKHGLLSHWRFLMRQSQRSYMEDTLKHIYECERGRITCTINSIAGTLSLKKDRVVQLIEQLKSGGLIRIENNQFFLTEKGNEYALRMIRLHRIWESYLAEETGTSDLEWHTQADLQEHKLDSAEAEKISERLGHPLYDPHGKPIPTNKGDLPSERGLLLTEIRKEQTAKIVQFEDDQENIYREIRENGLCLGMQIDSVQHQNGSILFKADGFKKKLPLIAAAQIRVELLKEEEKLQTPFANLLVLRNGESGKVLRISREIHGQYRRRLLDLGIVPGTIIQKEMESASGNPIAFRIKGASIALRKEQAKLIHIQKIERKNETTVDSKL